MIRERIADDIYVFTSRRYAQVTCGAILTKEGVVLVDTLMYPDEARAVRDFLEKRLNQHIRYVILTHYHADHTMGTFLYPQATVISHALCRELLDTIGREGLEQTKSQMPEFNQVDIVLPNMIVSHGTLDISLGGKQMRLIDLPGHSEDLMGVLLLDSNILFASDTMMPVPTFFDGSYDSLVASLKKVSDLEPDMVVQGHGEVVLRGEVQQIVDDHIGYMRKAHEMVEKIVNAGQSVAAVDEITIESCGKSRIPLSGLVTELHHANLVRIYEDLKAQKKSAGSKEKAV